MAVIIGTYYETAALYYDGRRQGECRGITRDEAKTNAEKLRDSLIKEYSGFPCYLYAKPELWEIKFL